ncbi:MAG: FAD-dependent monooxygenase, partial [Myxococcota bacterium]
DVVWFKMAYPQAWSPGAIRFVGGRGHLLLAGATADGLLQIGWVILKGTFGELKSRSHEAWVEELAHHADPELAAHLAAAAETITRPFLLNAVSDRVVGWATPGSLLIGAAAHTMSPVGGQGVNIALRDAIVAANLLVPAFRANGDVDAAAARVEAIRGRELNVIQRLQAMPPRVMLGTHAIHAMARRLAARFAGTSFGRARAAVGANLFLNGVTRVELEV